MKHRKVVAHCLKVQPLLHPPRRGGGKKGDPNRTLIWIRREGNFRYQGRAYYAIREGDWKLLQNHPFEPMQLVNLKKDPQEQNPKPANHPVARKLISKLMLHLQKSGDMPWQK